MTHISEISPDMPQIEGLDTKRIYILMITLYILMNCHII